MQNITEINLDSPVESSSPKINIIKTGNESFKKPELSVVNSIGGIQTKKIVPLDGLELLTDKKKAVKDTFSNDNKSNFSNGNKSVFPLKNTNTQPRFFDNNTKKDEKNVLDFLNDNTPNINLNIEKKDSNIVTDIDLGSLDSGGITNSALNNDTNNNILSNNNKTHFTKILMCRRVNIHVIILFYDGL